MSDNIERRPPITNPPPLPKRKRETTQELISYLHSLQGLYNTLKNCEVNRMDPELERLVTKNIKDIMKELNRRHKIGNE